MKTERTELSEQEAALIERAVSGDSNALESLLQAEHSRLLAYIEKHLPPPLKSSIEPSDVIQDTYFEACRLIELVDKPDFDLLALLVAQNRSGHFAIKAPDGGLLSRFGQELQTALPRFEDTEIVLRGGWLAPRGKTEHGGDRLSQKKTAAES